MAKPFERLWVDSEMTMAKATTGGTPIGGSARGFGSGTSFTAMALPFISPGTFLSSLAVYLSKSGAPTDNVLISIETDSGGSPSGTVAAQIATVSGASLVAGSSTPRISFTTGAILTPGTAYWVVLRRSGAVDAANFYWVGKAYGTAKSYKMWDGSTWGTGVAEDIALEATFSDSTFFLTDIPAEINPGAAIEKQALVTRGEAQATLSSPAAGWSDALCSGNRRTATPFVVPAANGRLTAYAHQIQCTPTAGTDNLIVEIYADNANAPGAFVGTVATIAGFGGVINAGPIACNISLTPGAMYWLVWRRSNTSITENSYGSNQGGYSLPNWPGKRRSTDGGATWGAQEGGVPTNMTLTFGSAPVSTVAVTNSAAGPTAPIPITASAGGTPVEWYTPPLPSFILGGKAKFNLRTFHSNAAVNGFPGAEIAVVNNDGSGAVVWGSSRIPQVGTGSPLGTGDTARTVWVSGDDVAISDGQRLRFRSF